MTGTPVRSQITPTQGGEHTDQPAKHHHILGRLPPMQGPSPVHTPTHVSGLYVCAWSECTHRERSQPLPSSLGEGSGGQRGWGVIGFGVSYLCCPGSFLCFIFSLINP